MGRYALLTVSSIGLGSWLIFDALFAILTGDYFLPESLRPWVKVLEQMSIDPYSFAPGLLALGFLWFIAAFSLLSLKKWSKSFIVFTSLLSLLYVPFGTFVGQLGLIFVASYLAPRAFQKNHMIRLGFVLSIVTTAFLINTLGDL